MKEPSDENKTPTFNHKANENLFLPRLRSESARTVSVIVSPLGESSERWIKKFDKSENLELDVNDIAEVGKEETKKEDFGKNGDTEGGKGELCDSGETEGEKEGTEKGELDEAVNGTDAQDIEFDTEEINTKDKVENEKVLVEPVAIVSSPEICILDDSDDSDELVDLDNYTPGLLVDNSDDDIEVIESSIVESVEKLKYSKNAISEKSKNESKKRKGMGGPERNVIEIVDNTVKRKPVSEEGRRATFKCMICLDAPKNSVMVKLCGHIFCESCIMTSLLTTAKCPICRKSVSERNLVSFQFRVKEAV
ncbi:hypothetical protein BB559_004112 [Furculomyces boomerangus]|uniref:RING-type domain-containing protein n=2 Tax=Harpellales TaxID=61421 RepID=A0A2T9YGQ9_9FUNG|nr:hypothetical protein BB559_004112 [Furculomyces boomerangus]PVZ99318.1 hypothetical protein BB558_004655 [Smittium angustum]